MGIFGPIPCTSEIVDTPPDNGTIINGTKTKIDKI
jgi:hypothetical protein